MGWYGAASVKLLPKMAILREPEQTKNPSREYVRGVATIGEFALAEREERSVWLVLH
jgi:hypothetical protein